MRALFFLVIIILSITSAKAQDKLLLMNGQELNCRILEDTSIILKVEIPKRKGKLIEREIHRNEIFSYTKSGQKEIVLYVQDTIIGDIYTIDQMRVYMAGEKDARQNYKQWPIALAGFVVCGGIAYYGGDGYITTFAPPVAFMLIHLIPKIHIRERYISNPSAHQYNDFYADGFGPVARSKKVTNAMLGGFGGSATSIAIWYIFRNHK